AERSPRWRAAPTGTGNWKRETGNGKSTLAERFPACVPRHRETRNPGTRLRLGFQREDFDLADPAAEGEAAEAVHGQRVADEGGGAIGEHDLPRRGDLALDARCRVDDVAEDGELAAA